MPGRLDVVVHQCTPQGYKQIVLFVSFQQRLWARVTVQLRCGWRCLDTLQTKDCYSAALRFCSQTDHLFCLCPSETFHVHESQCHYISITLHVNKLDQKKKREQLPSLQLLHYEILSFSSRPFCLLFQFLVVYKTSQDTSIPGLNTLAHNGNHSWCKLYFQTKSWFSQPAVSWPHIPLMADPVVQF